MRRIRVVGNTGSGKTSLAAEVARRLGLPHLELDALQHRANWEPAPLDEFQAAAREFVAASEASSGGWVVDGNYTDRSAGLFEDADTFVWLDYSRAVVMKRLLRRTFGRLVFRRELWNGNREELRNLLSADPDRNVVLWSWTQHAVYRRRYETASLAAGVATWIRLGSPAESRSWVAALRQSRSSG